MNKFRLIWLGLVSGAFLGIPWLALNYFAWQVWSIPFAPFDLFGWVTRLLPGNIVTAGVELLVGSLQRLDMGSTSELGKAIEAVMALGLSLGVMAALGAIHAYTADAISRRPWVNGILLGVVLWLVFLPAGYAAGWVLRVLAWYLATSVIWGIAVAVLIARWLATTPHQTTSEQTDAVTNAPPSTGAISRRKLIMFFGAGAAAVTAVALGLTPLLRRTSSTSASGQTVTLTSPPPPTPEAANAFQPVPGTRAAVTPIAEFYRVDINLVPPEVDANSWTLEIGGLVDRPYALSYAEIAELPREDFYATLECISNQVGGDLISTTWFSGIKLSELLDRAGLQNTVQEIKFTCADGYTESLTLDAALDPATHVCLLMGGVPLEPLHGFPARLYVPNRYGMKNPKWLQKIEAIGEPYNGYWEQRGWTKQAIVKTTSVIDTVSSPGAGEAQAGGIAFAGARGIREVQVRVDEQEWQAAELQTPLSDWSWVLWAADLDTASGGHQLTVRAVDGAGEVQTEQAAPPIPDGASGYYRVSF